MAVVHCIVYFSSSVGLFDQAIIDDILQQSRHYNAQVGITGVLLYINGSIIQVLEGPEDTVQALYGRIKRDPRHEQVTCVVNHSIQARLFTHWSMGYQTLTTTQLAEVRTILALDEPLSAADGEPVILRTLKGFYQVNRRAEI